MKRKIVFWTVLIFLVMTGYALAQSPTTLSLDFTEGKRGNFYCWNAKFTFSFENNEMVVAWNKPAGDWDQMVYWVAPFKFKTTTPYMSFKYRVDGGNKNWTVTFKYDDATQTAVPLTLLGDGISHVAFIDLTDKIEDLSASNYEVNEIQFDAGSPSSGTIYIDDFKLGDAAKPSYKKPTIGKLPNLVVAAGAGEQTVNLSGITDGGEGYQILTISAVTADNTLITDPVVEYTSPDKTGTLKFTPQPGQTGTTEITITVKDDGPLNNEISTTFMVAVVETEGTGFSDDFEAASMASSWKGNSDYSFVQSDGILQVDVHKNAPWEAFTYEPERVYDLASKPVVNLLLNSNEPAKIAVYLKDVFGQVALREVRVYNTSAPVNYCFDFTGETALNLGAVNGLIFAVNGSSQSADRNFILDDFRVGSEAARFPNMGGIKDKSYYISTGSKTIQLTDIERATTITASGGESLVTGLTVGPLTGENATLQFLLLDDASGKDTITLLLDGGLEATNAIRFAIEVTGNSPPAVDQVPDIKMIAGEEFVLKLSGITDGDPDAAQDLSLSAISGSENLVLEGPSYSGGSYATLSLKAINPDTLENSIIVSDGITADTVLFNVTIYESLNKPPVMDPVADVTAFFGSGEKTVNLAGIADGDGASQQLTITAVSGDETIVPNPIAVDYTEGDNATLVFTPNQAVAGKSVISVTLGDNGGIPGNDGDKSAVYTFVVETRPDPVTGYVVPMTDWETDSASGVWGAEGWGMQFNLAYVDSGDFQSMKIDMKDKWDYGGIWMDLPLELDLTKHPYISYEIYSVDNPTYHWNYLYDEGVDGSIDRNIQNSEEHMLQVPSNKWTLLSFDYSDEGDLNNSAGDPINIARINAVLLNLHNRKGGWPFTNYTGTVYYRNIRLGDQAIVPPKKYSCTIDGISDQGVYVNAGEISISLTGISDGQDSTENVTLSASSSDAGIIPTPEITSPDDEGNAVLSFMAGSSVGISVISIKASAPGSSDKTITFRVSLSSNEVGASALVTVDPDQTFQTIQGLGTFQTRSDVADLYLNMGSSAVRLGVIGNQVEWENDNDDPFVLNMEALDRGAWDFDYLRHLKANGVEKFILTLWSAPAWMKQNLSLDQIEQAIEWENTDNKVEPYYYDEYAENVIATIRLLKDEGIDVYAVCPQNEPAFNEPYPSAILGPNQFRDFIKILGPRFDAEGLDTRIYMPEQVFGIGFYSMDQYMNAVKNDPIADENTEIIAVHGYADDGITPGEPDYSQWNDMWTAASTGNHPKELWMTETHVGYTGFADALRVAGAMHGGFKYGNISWWTNWSFEDMQLTKLKPNSTYYTSMNYVKYIRPGAMRIGSSSSHVDVMETTFYHPEDNTYTIVLINKSMTAVSVNLKGDNIPQAYRAFRTSQYMNFEEIDSVRNDLFLLPPNSVTTLVADRNSALTMDAIADQYLTVGAPEQTVNVTGIGNGSGGISGLSLSVQTDNAVLLPDVAVSNIDAEGNARVTFTPAAEQTGAAKITLTLSDGTSLPRVVTFYVVVGVTGVKESTAARLRLYPNPAYEVLFIEIPGENTETLTVTDISGRIIEQRQVSGSVITLDVHHYRSGIYLLQAKSKNGVFISRFMKR